MRSSCRFNLLSLTSLVLFSLSGCFDDGPQGDQEIVLTAAEVALKETYLQSGSANKNQGTDPEVVIKDSGNNRALVQFELTAIEVALTNKILQKAELEFTITHNGNNWGSNGRLVDVHRMTQDWTETGATWNCAIDTDPSNSAKDCSGATEWEMGSGSNPWEFLPSHSFIVQSNQSGTLRVNITEDLKKFLNNQVTNYGFIIKKADESQSGRIEFSSREGTAPATLVLSVSDSPNAIDDEYETFESRSLIMDVLSNDQVVSGETLTIVGFTQGTLGSVELYSSTELLYTPSSTGSDSFTYTIEDSVGNQSNATVSVETKSIFQAHESKTIDLKSNGDTFIRSGGANSNEGGALELEVQSSGKNRTLIQFSDDFVTELQNLPDSFALDTAILEFTISQNGNNWGSSGRNIDVHRMTQTWEERRATWNCAIDSDPTNSSKDCSGAFVWEMGNGSNPWNASVTDSVLITNNLSGAIQFDVTSDVELIAAGSAPNAGWIVKLSNESQNGKVFFHSMESANPPKLTLTYSDTNTVPNAMDDSASLSSGSEIDIDVLANDTDPDAGDSISVTSFTQGSQGTVSLNPNGTLKYTLTGSTQSSDEFFYTIQDNHGAQDTARVTVNFPTDTDPPVISTDLTTPLLTNNPSLSFNVMISDASSTNTRVILNSVEEFQSTQFTFAVNLTLAEGLNVIEIESTDSAGNVATLVLSDITLDTTAPVLSNLVPATNDTVSTLTFSVSGDSNEQLSSVTLNSQALTISGNSFSGSFTASQEGSLVLTWDATDLAGNTSQVSYSITLDTGGSTTLPPNPEDVAPELPESEVIGFLDSVSFLFDGTNPIQTGVTAGSIVSERASVVRGTVFDINGTPLSGVKVSIQNRPEWGETLTRQDGEFDMAVNGGNELSVVFEKSGFVTSHRSVEVPWNQFRTTPDTVLIALDTNSTVVDLSGGSTGAQVAQGSSITDSDGTRKATLIIPANTSAQLVLQNGTLQSVSSQTIRATEYTVGANGPKAMPAELPSTSMYTYAVELNSDEAIANEAKKVIFSQPIYFYVENFISFPVGTAVPSGFYDRSIAEWISSQNGRVIKVLNENAGVAELDVDGSGTAANSTVLANLGFTNEELQKVADLYAPGDELWRVSIPHFTPWDFNWPFTLAVDAITPNASYKDLDFFLEQFQPVCRSVVQVENQILGESVAIAGSSDRLHYSSDKVPARTAANSFEIKLSGSSVPSSLLRIELDIEVAGQKFSQSFTPAPDLVYEFTWDRKDVYGRTIEHQVPVAVSVAYIYSPTYSSVPIIFADAFARFFDPASPGSLSIGARGQSEAALVSSFTRFIGLTDARIHGLGGWTLSSHHFYDPEGRVLYRGDGTKRNPEDVGLTIENVAGQTSGGFSGDGGLAVDAELFSPSAIALDADGSIYIADLNNLRIRKVTPDGIINTIAGTGSFASTGDGGPATSASVRIVSDLVVSNDGTIFFNEDGRRIRKIGTNGIITKISGDGMINLAMAPDGTAASSILYGANSNLIHEMAIGDDGSIYFAMNAGQIYQINPAGLIYKVFDNGTAPNIEGLALDSEGRLYFLNNNGFSNSAVIRRIESDGTITHVAGTGSATSAGDGGQATLASFRNSFGLTFDEDDNLYVAETIGRRVRKINKDGIVTTFVGSGINAQTETGLPPTLATLSDINDVSFGPDGKLYIASSNQNHQVFSVGFPLPGFSDNPYIIASQDNSELYKFSSNGRHLETINPLTGQTKLVFNYNGDGFLTTIVDADSNILEVERDASNIPTAIISPDGNRTELFLNGDGYLSQTINPNLESYQFAYHSSEGLLQSFTDARSNSSTFTYDSKGRLSRDQDAATGFIDLVSTNLATGFNVSTFSTLSRQTSTQVEVNALDELLRTRSDEANLSTVVTEKTNGQVVTDSPTGMTQTQTFMPDPRFGMQRPYESDLNVLSPGGLNFQLTRNRSVVLADPTDPFSLQSQTETTTINSKSFVSFYDAATKTITNSTPEGRQVSTVLDSNERVTQEQVTGLTAVNFSYNAKGRVSSVAQGARNTTFTYNAEGYLDKITNPLTQDVSFTYDGAGRVLTQTLNDGRVIQFAYDANGNLKEVTPPGKPKHEFFYDLVNLFTDYTPPAIGGAITTTREYNLDRQLTRITRPDGKVIDFAYDGDVPADPNTGQLKEIQTPSGNYAFSYFGTGNLQTLSSPDTVDLTFGYDGSLLTGSTWSGNTSGSVSVNYNNDFQISSEFVNGANSVSYTYDNDDLMIQAGAESIIRDVNHGLLRQLSIGSMVEDFDYNSFGELDTQEAKFGATSLYSASIVRDSLGRISTKAETVQGVTSNYVYNYDSTGRLDTVIKDAVQIADYDYDSNSNRTLLTTTTQTLSGSYDDQDRLTSYGTLNFTYNQNGDLLSKTDTSTSQTTNYVYDSLGNLKSVTLPNADLIEYLVDGRNRRVARKLNGVFTSKYLYKDQLNPVVELDGSNAVVSRFVYGAKANVPDYMVKGGVTYKIVSDHLGSVRLVVDTSSGTIVQRMDYDEFGVVTQDTNPGFQPFGFAGGLFDSSTGLTRFGARDYNPGTGRFTNKDPILFEGRDTNLYGYVLNDPINFVDPFGLQNALGLPGVPSFVTPNFNQGAINFVLAGGTVAAGVTIGSAAVITAPFVAQGASALTTLCLANPIVCTEVGIATGEAIGLGLSGSELPFSPRSSFTPVLIDLFGPRAVEKLKNACEN